MANDGHGGSKSFLGRYRPFCAPPDQGPVFSNLIVRRMHGALSVGRWIFATLSTDTNKLFALLKAMKLMRKPRYITGNKQTFLCVCHVGFVVA